MSPLVVPATRPDRCPAAIALGLLLALTAPARPAPASAAAEARAEPGTLAVRVTDRATGATLAGAGVVLDRPEAPRDRRTDAAGAVAFGPLAPGECAVTVRAGGHARATRTVVIPAGRAAEVEIPLDPGASVAGVVRDPSGRPIEGVGFVGSPWSGVRTIRYVGREAVTDRDGRYRLDFLPVGSPIMLDATKRDYVDGERVVTLGPGGATVDLTMAPLPDAGPARGVVLDPAGRPVAGATVINRRHLSVEHRRATTGPDGRFAFDRIYEDKFRGPNLLVKAAGFAPRRVAVPPAAPGEAADLRVALEPGHKVAGRIVDDRGQPVAAVKVFASNEILGDFDGDRRATAADGRFEFDDLPAPDAAPTRFEVQHPEFSALHRHAFPVDAPEPVAVPLEPKGVILGRAVDAGSGRPVAAFTVRVRFSPYREEGDPPAVLESTRLVDPGLRVEAPDGRFRLGDLANRLPLQVTVEAPGYERTTRDRLVAAPADRARPEEFPLNRADDALLETYAGRLRDADGRPLAGVQLRLIAVEHLDPDDERAVRVDWYSIRDGELAGRARVARFLRAVSDADGRFTFPAVPRFHDVTLAWWGDAVAADRRDDLAGLPPEGKRGLDLDLSPPSRIVVAVDRRQFPTARLLAVHREEDRSWGLVPSPLPFDGAELAVPNLPPGRYHLELRGPNPPDQPGGGGGLGVPVAKARVDLRPGQTARVAFPSGGD